MSKQACGHRCARATAPLYRLVEVARTIYASRPTPVLLNTQQHPCIVSVKITKPVAGYRLKRVSKNYYLIGQKRMIVIFISTIGFCAYFSNYNKTLSFEVYNRLLCGAKYNILPNEIIICLPIKLLCEMLFVVD